MSPFKYYSMKIYAGIVLVSIAMTFCNCKEEAASGVTNKGSGIGIYIQIKFFTICSFWILFMFELVNINLIWAI
jgi:hypothetical protein